MNLVINAQDIKQGFKFYKALFIVFISIGITACQNTVPIEKSLSPQSTEEDANNTIVTNTVSFGQYYLKLKTLSDAELQKEIEEQQAKKRAGNIEAGINLILLYSLPNSSIHNVYSAKSQLNEQLKTYQNYPLSTADQAFIRLLKDQLNQQLFLFQKLINQELAYDKQVTKNRINEKKQVNKIAALELTVKQLTEQITQLKKIEQNISEHGQ
ncbi:hypothetical protein Q4506_15435 [Colwellia sp. 4_MG-2023]|jgi:hypothetical protein|uniref:hypothetical protein n=1 Tax=unclassified Colwellia TaxID=196834 RepID=UPI001C087D92|nr:MULTISPECIES: hypothetical protein [unclassified Colwellia]MBU2923840.1 hypothetical protein [Colwellia sp. C2M11]MDO6488277.1 hypothetical protein [Colwellia sp. 6_MG-2023]MDO6508437.1 hypothetical protein [Colwellia sp. 5_MG-2023]MDO6557076.1 hypothetical protein [Colwellia sp. 4_MG-2023]MDO6651916.1 hypothetical protein [Colwellia sp. 3_MG-2023]